MRASTERCKYSSPGQRDKLLSNGTERCTIPMDLSLSLRSWCLGRSLSPTGHVRPCQTPRVTRRIARADYLEGYFRFGKPRPKFMLPAIFGCTFMSLGYICRFSRRNGIDAWSWLFETLVCRTISPQLVLTQC